MIKKTMILTAILFTLCSNLQAQNFDLDAALAGDTAIAGEVSFRADFDRADIIKLIATTYKSLSLRELNLTFVDLSGLDFSGADFSGAVLWQSNLSGANLLEANFSRAYLGGANLSGANLSGANLTGADFSGVDLTGAVLRKVIGINTIKRWVHFRGT